MSSLKKWAQNTQIKLNGAKNSNNQNNSSTNGERKWIHPPEALQKGHIAYLVKFLGNTVVEQSKGIEVVKEGIRKLRFTQQLRKSETGAKTRKVELTVSIDGVAIQEPRTHQILHQFPLHRISYCADDKGEKKFFSFIAKQPNQVDNEAEDTHECFVFISDKLAEEITLTIGQAFELAYRRFLDTSGKDLEAQRRQMLAQQKIKRLEQENNAYKQRLLDLAGIPAVRTELDNYLRRNELKHVLELKQLQENKEMKHEKQENNNNEIATNTNTQLPLLDLAAPPIPPRAFENTPTVGTRLEGLLLNEVQDDDFDPRSFETNSIESNFGSPPALAPPPKAAKRFMIPSNGQNGNNTDPFGSEPFSPQTPNSAKILDPFEMGEFGSSGTTSQDIENAIGLLDKRILEMKTGFSRGISFGNEDFSIESLDPLKN